MLEVIQPIIDLLQQKILEYDKKNSILQSINNSLLMTHYERLLEARDDIYLLRSLDLDIFKEIINDFNISNEDKDNIYQNIKSIKLLLSLNEKHNATYKIDDSQLKYFEMFYDKLVELFKLNCQIIEDNILDIGELSRKNIKYKEILNCLEDEGNTKFITDLKTLKELFKDKEKEYLLLVMKYNELVKEKVLVKGEFTKKKIYTYKDYVDLFSKYNYDFYQLDDKLQEQLLEYGNYLNISEMFNYLDKHNFSFVLPKDSFKLVIILINCNLDAFSSIYCFSKLKGLKNSEILSLIPALVPEGTDLEDKLDIKDNRRVIIKGKSDDFVRNVMFFEKIGFSVREIYQKCKVLLVMSHKQLISNYQVFKDYDLVFEVSSDKHLTYSGLSFLASVHLAEIIDRFIECCDEGYSYIKNNINRLSGITSYDDIVFYNIYASYMRENEYGVPLMAEGPFVRRGSKNPILRREILRYAGSGYEKIPYLDIEDYNKKKKTKTIEPLIVNKDKFRVAIILDKEDIELVSNEEDEVLLKLEEFIDKNNPLRYNFQGILISRNKVRRVWNILKKYNLDKEEDSLLFAVSYHSIMNEEEFIKLKDILTKKVKY